HRHPLLLPSFPTRRSSDLEVILRWLPGAAAIKAEWAVVAPIRSHLQHAFVLEEAVIAPERHTAAIFSRTCLVRHEFISRELDRIDRKSTRLNSSHSQISYA